MFRVGEGGVSVAGELYEVGDDVLPGILETEPPHLYMGDVLLVDGEQVKGMLCPEEVAKGKPEISDYGDWRRYVAAGKNGA